MTTKEQVLELLKEKQNHFLEFFRITEKMCFCPIEELIDLMEQRLKLQTKIDAINQELEKLYLHAPDLEQAVKQPLETPNQKDETEQIRDLSLSVRGIISQIQEYGPTLQERVELEKEGLMKKIQELNKSSATIADKYYNTIRSGAYSQNPHFANKGIKA